jgi:hypothetical protein
MEEFETYANRVKNRFNDAEGGEKEKGEGNADHDPRKRDDVDDESSESEPEQDDAKCNADLVVMPDTSRRKIVHS